MGFALLFGAAVMVTAQTGHITPFTGKWKLNLAKSKFNPGPPFRSFRITFTTEGTRHLDLLGPDGVRHTPALPWSDGREVSIEGMPKTTAISRIRGRTFHDIWKQDGHVIEDVRGFVSANGKSFRTTVDGTDSQGRSYHNELVFNRQ